MKSFDVIIFSPWPKGLYLAQQLHEVHGKKVCYIESFKEPLPPFGVFLKEGQKQEQTFLESQGFLTKQGGGFCVLTPQGVWQLQEAQHLRSQIPPKWDWLSSLSHNLMNPIFEHNRFTSSLNSLDLFSDYYLFSPSIKKKKEFKEKAQWTWKTLQTPSQIQWGAEGFSFEGEEFQAQHIFCLAEEVENHRASAQSPSVFPEWRWRKLIFSGDLGSYQEVVPCHFVCINHLSLPWTHDNLLNVFQDKERWEVWLRLPARSLSGKEKKELIGSVTKSLGTFFKGTSFHFLKEGEEGFAVYGKEKLKQSKLSLKKGSYPSLFKSIDFFKQIELVSFVQSEKEILKKVFL